MTQLGVPVPAGFTITTDACRAYMEARGELPEGLDDEIEEHLGALEEKTGKRFGDPSDPLLVSVRSGAAISYAVFCLKKKKQPTVEGSFKLDLRQIVARHIIIPPTAVGRLFNPDQQRIDARH